MKKRIILLFMAISLIIPTISLAQEQPIKLIVGGITVETDVAPFIENGRTLVPIRVISETLGFKVDWFGEEEKVVIGDPKDEGSGNALSLFIGDTTAYVSEYETVTLDVAPKIVNGRTFVPVRFVAEQFGLKVDWDESNWAVIIGEAKTSSNQIQTFAKAENTSSNENVEGNYVGNKNTGVFHYQHCPSVNKMADRNKVGLESKEAALSKGFRSCQICNP